MIRALAATDRGPVGAILRAAGNFTDAELAVADELISVVLTQPGQKDYHGFVSEDDGDVTGFLILGPVPATEGSWHLYWIAVDPPRHGAGVAQELDAWAGRFVRERGGYWLLVETSSQPSYERTRAFYRKQGYAQLARIPDYYRPGDDLLLLGRRL